MKALEGAIKKPWVKYSLVGVGVLGAGYIAYKYVSPTASAATGATSGSAIDPGLLSLQEQQNSINASAASQGASITAQNDLANLQAQEALALAQINSTNIANTLNATTTQQANAITGTIASQNIVANTQLGLSGNALTGSLAATGAGLVSTGAATSLVKAFGFNQGTPATASAIASASMPAASIASASPAFTVAADGAGLGSLTTAATATNISPLGTFAASATVDTATTTVGTIAASDAVAAGISSGAVTAAAYGAADYAGAAVATDAIAGAATGAASGFSFSSLLSLAACFITTAACKYRGLKDNCYALETLRYFRDRWMLRNHPEDVHEYYRHAPGIVARIEARPDAAQIFGGFYDAYIISAVLAIERGDNYGAYHIYCNLYRKAERMALENVATV